MKHLLALLSTLALVAACHSPRASGAVEPAATAQPEIRYYMISDA